MHEVLVDYLGGKSLPRECVVRLNDHPDVTIDVYLGHKTTQQQQIKGWTLQSYHVTRLSSHASCNVGTNERGLKLLEFATFNNLVLTNTLCPHKQSRRRTWQSADRKHHNQSFWSGVNIHRTRSFPEADIGSDHDLVMMTFPDCLKKARKQN